MQTCEWCEGPIPADARKDAKFCKQRCRQTAFRLRRRHTTDAALRGSMRFAYADPPYPGTAERYYGREATFAGEVDHGELIAELEAGGYAGWALSTSSDALRDVLPRCPRGARVCSWVKPLVAPKQTNGLHSRWEALIVVRGRQRTPGVRDWLLAAPARFGGNLVGRKPIAFCAWMFDCQGMLPGDELVDLFPGTGVVMRAWRALSFDPSRSCSSDASPLERRRFQASLVDDGRVAGGRLRRLR